MKVSYTDNIGKLPEFRKKMKPTLIIKFRTDNIYDVPKIVKKKKSN